MNSVISPEGHCVFCGDGEHPDNPLRPYTGVAWVHPGCWPALLRARQAELTLPLPAELDFMHPSSPNGICIQCGVGELPPDDVHKYPVVAWVHKTCRRAWLRARLAEATAALSVIGIRK
jgi:hypothetical protein